MELTVQFDPKSAVGVISESPYCEILSPPTWDHESQRWRALANYESMLCIVELSLRIKGNTAVL